MFLVDTDDRLRVGDVTVDFASLARAGQAIAAGHLQGDVHLCNAYTLALAEEQPEIAASLHGSAANFPDGTPLVWWARRRGIERAERVYGPDLMEAVLAVGHEHSTRHYLYGSTPAVLDSLEREITRRWPDSTVVGTESPPFRELDDDEVRASVERAAALDATVVWVGMGTPKQDLLVRRMATMGDATYVAIGAAFDFISGTKAQAPRWVMKLGLEWLFRLVTEPRRLWKRYLVYNVKFIRLLFASR